MCYFFFSFSFHACAGASLSEADTPLYCCGGGSGSYSIRFIWFSSEYKKLKRPASKSPALPNDAPSQQRALWWYYNCVFRLLKDQRRRAMGMKRQHVGYPKGKALYM